ncbi:uncharacterized protein LOC133965298 [Platichthys flesus]|uniref:uncharacterized protein LOC133965298 n=1 Tax=Platichthys flesus TaxID=8260 RepID=UPI002DBBE560|nr:uncharacterized protein LOC133965298 [Platichthys flesus]
MSHTISTRVLQALESLTGTDLERFCFHLRTRKDEPKIGRRQVDETNPVKIADLLVSKFTELGALKVVLETLRLIGCNQEAETLESETKACLDKGDPETSNGKLDRKPLQEVTNYADGKFPLKAAQQGDAPVMMIKQEEVADHKKEGEPSVSQMTAQKVLEEVRARDRSLQPGQEGEALVGFGRHETETLKDLYESMEEDKISYVHYLRRKKKSCRPGSKMEVAIRYILQRDQGQDAASTAPSRSLPRATRKKRSNQPKVKRT